MGDDLAKAVTLAEAPGRMAMVDEPRAKSSHDDAAAGSVTVDLGNGCTFAFPARPAQWRETATGDMLTTVGGWHMASVGPCREGQGFDPELVRVPVT